MQLNDIPDGIERVLSVSAHPDDSEFFAGGALAKFIDAGARVTLAICTDGGRGGRGTNDIAGVRHAEQDAAAKALGISEVIRLGYLDGDLEASDELRDSLIGILRQSRPQVVLGHHPATFYTRYGSRVQLGHSDHRAAGTALMNAIYPRSASPNFSPGRGGDPWFPQELWLFDCNEPDFLVDISTGFDRKLDALTAHDSQQGVGGGLVRAASRVGSLLGNDEQPAEGFVRLGLR